MAFSVSGGNAQFPFEQTERRPGPLEAFRAYTMIFTKAALIMLSIAILVRCIRSMLRERYEPETWAYLRSKQGTLPVTHWENLIGRSRSVDLRLNLEKISRVHAVLIRSERGNWHVYDVFSKGGIWVNGARVGAAGLPVHDGDILNLAGNRVRFLDLAQLKREKLEASRSSAGRTSPAITLLALSLFQLFLLLQHALSAAPLRLGGIALGFASLLALEWTVYNAMRVIGRLGFEVEILAFYLTTLGMSVAASSTPQDMLKQILLTTAAVGLFLLCGWWLRNLRRAFAFRLPVAALALALLGLNVVASDAVLGARNWLSIGGYSFQPSELVKWAYVYVGASTLDKLYRRRNLFSFIAFSAVCVVALAMIGDFGTALVFFVTFLVISFLRSGSIATVFLALSGAGLAGFLAMSIKPYIARRFASWGHVWEDMYDTGYQQTRAMSAAAAGGLFGKGAGQGWLKGIFAANTDMVFAMVCEEQGLIIGLCMVTALLTLAFFAVRSARQGRSAFYAIAACATMSMLLTQLGLNVFGSLDLLPFTGVTFPFVSRGGTSLLSCWMMMAFLKGADTRREASFAVRPGEAMASAPKRKAPAAPKKAKKTRKAKKAASVKNGEKRRPRLGKGEKA